MNTRGYLKRGGAALAVIVIVTSAIAIPGKATANSVQGSPSGTGLSASVPVTATVAPHAEVTFTNCAFGPLAGPSATATCTSSPQIRSNANVNVTFQPTRLRRTGGQEHLTSSYTFAQGTGQASARVSADTGSTVTSVAFAQPGANLNTPTTYQVSGSASVIAAETVAGSYTGNITITVVAQ